MSKEKIKETNVEDVIDDLEEVSEEKEEENVEDEYDKEVAKDIIEDASTRSSAEDTPVSGTSEASIEETAEKIIEEVSEEQNDDEVDEDSSAEEIVEDVEEEIVEEKLEKGNIPDVDLSEVLEGEKEIEAPKTIITSSTVDEIDEGFERKEEDAINLVEAALFVAGRFLSMQELILLTDLNQILIKDVIKKLEKKYKDGAIRIVERSNMFKMDLAPNYHYLINKLASGESEFTKAEQETLAVIAYKQPIKQSVIIKIRGNKSYDHIRKFRDLGLVMARPTGHTLELSLSEEFYEYFNVHNQNAKEE